MKLFILFTFFLFSTLVYVQEWAKMHYTQVGAGNAQFGKSYLYNNSKLFQINPADSSFWFASGAEVHRLELDGTQTVFEYTDFPTGTNWSTFIGIAFTSNAVFVLDEYRGLYKYENSSWTLELPINDGCFLHADGDTVWVTQMDVALHSWKAGQTHQYPYSYLRRVQARNGSVWGSQDIRQSSVCFFSNNTCQSYNPSNSILTNYGNYDFKFARLSDTLFMSYESGFALAYGDSFVDSITPFNCTNMPTGKIIEFEFDANDNIWAVFGDGSIGYKPTSLAFYNRQTRNWSNFYDATNSPIDFNEKNNIEIDYFGNLWLCTYSYLYYLNIGTDVGWQLATYKIQNDLGVHLFPNPANQTLNITLSSSEKVEKIEFLDAQGKVLKEEYFKNQFDVSAFESGIYFLLFLGENEVLKVKKWVKE